VIAIDKLSNRAKCERASEIKGLRKRVAFPPKTGLYLGKRIRIGRSGLEEDPDWRIRIGTGSSGNSNEGAPPFISTIPVPSQETHEDTWQGRKLAEEAQDKLGSR